MNLLNFLFSFLALLFSTSVSLAQHNHSHKGGSSPLKYIQNNGQWDSHILYEAKLGNGSVYLESTSLTFAQYSQEDLNQRSELYHDQNNAWKQLPIHGHSWKVSFLNSQALSPVSGQEKLKEYHNYFIGDDQSKWAGEVPLFEQVRYFDLYKNIDLLIYSQKGQFKYDFVVKPNANTAQIRLNYQGLDGVKLNDGNLVLNTTLGEFVELKPYAYQLINGKKIEISCTYKLEGKVISFEFKNQYNPNFELIIDPVLVAATLSGTSGSGDNYGHAATFDLAGNIYTGAINFSSGYPSTIGAFQTVNGGGFTDIAISKLNPTGTTLLYATYLGGSDEEYPHSMFVNSVNELFILGTTASFNFPTTVGAYDNTLSGSGDIVISHFSTNGSTLIGSTYIGGSSGDGINSVTYNYGDSYRGEIIVDPAGNCYVASTTNSTNFPTTAGVYQTTFGGGTSDAVFFKMNSTLSTLSWSTYLGGTGDESAFGLRLDNAGDVFGCGTTDGNMMTANGYQTTSSLGNDGFVIKLANNGTTIPNSTYIATADDDKAFFIDIDIAGRIYVYGQTEGTAMTSTTGNYNIAGSGQFINRFNATLTTRDISSRIGGGSLNEFVPIAFMVDNCGYIYFSGHSSYSTLPTTSLPIQLSGGFYLGVLTPDAVALHYATHYGGSGDHVDGGTSRFDPHGIVYQGVCTASGFNTTAGAYGPFYPAGWDIGVFKIDFQLNPLIASASFTSSNNGCAPVTVTFTNTSNGTSYIWDFGDGSPTSTVINPSHTYTTPGNYVVSLIANSSTSCVTSDTTYFNINVPAQLTIDLGPDLNICSGTTILDPGPFAGASYVWQDASTNQNFTVTSGGTYYVTVSSGPCTASDTVVITYGSMLVDLGLDQTLCQGDAVTLDAGNPGSTYLWSNGLTTQTISVSTAGTYWVQVNGANCVGSDTVQINTETLVPDFSVADTVGCSLVIAHFTNLSVGGTPGATYSWSFGDGSSGTGQNPTHHYLASGTYSVTLTITTTYGCVVPHTENINILVYPSPFADFSFSPIQPESGAPVFFTDESTNALIWNWSFGDGATSTIQNPTHTFNEIDNFDVWLVVENNGCFDSAHASIKFDYDIIYYVPNAFTPDADGYNHVFQPIFTEGFSPFKYELTIYNRWGEVVFESFDAKAPWDGTYNGVLSPQGVYTWKITFGEEYTDERHIVLGHVFLLK